MKRFLFLFCLIPFFRFASYCADFYENGFAFRVISELDSLCAIVQNERTPYTGDIVIPSFAHYNGKKYQVYQIEEEAFYDCDNLISIKIPSTLKAIKSNCFVRCNNLSKINIEDSDESLTIGYAYDYNIFQDSPISDLYIGRNIAYASCNSNKSDVWLKGSADSLKVIFGDKVTSINPYMFTNSRNITELHLGHNIKSIGTRAFEESLNGISTIVFPESLETISSDAFYGNKCLREIILDANIKTIGSDAFTACSGITLVYCYAITPPSATNAANSFDLMNARLRVPAESLEKYKSAPGIWSNFNEILAIGEESNFYPGNHKILFTLGNQGNIRNEVSDGTTLSFNVQPELGWNIHSLLVNGTDISSEIDNNGNFKIGPIHEDIIIDVVFKGTSNINSVVNCNNNPNVKVIIEGRVINIQGDFNLVELYDTNGVLLKSGHINSYEISNPGVYVMKVDGNRYKFLIR